MTDVLARMVRVARGQEPADLVVAGGRVVDVLTQQVRRADVAIVGDRIAAVADGGLAGREEVDAGGRLIAPGFIDAHVHIESSMVAPGRFADAVLPHGTTTIVSDPHEIANVLGVRGIEWMLAASGGLDLSVLVMAPACVPASPLETSGARLVAADLFRLTGHPRVLGLAEMMNYPGVLAADRVELSKLEAFVDAGLLVDGHAPGVVGRDLQAYLAAGIVSDHECLTAEEAREKVANGMTVFLREATNARNLLDVLPAVTPENARRFAFCTDDRVPGELLDDGSIDALVRMAIAAGLDPITAITMATLNPAEHYMLRDRGAVAPGRRADLVVFGSLDEVRPELVIARGRVVARDGERIGGGEGAPDRLPPTMNVAWRDDLRLARAGDRVRAIGLVEDQLVTTSSVVALRGGDDVAGPDPAADLLRLTVVERHHATGNVGAGFVTGFGLQAGALASTVAHDSHNIVVAAADDGDALVAARAAAELGGGLVVAAGGEVRATVPLPLAGLMADRPPREVADELARAEAVARELGCRVAAPFMALSFLALPVIPSLKLTDRGLVDVDAFALTDVFV